MLELITSQDFAGLLYYVEVRVSIVVLCWFFAIISSLVDFWSGVATAKALGKKLMSRGFRRTITKIIDYTRVLIFAIMFDILAAFLPFWVAPFATLLCTAAIMLIEAKSVIENNKRKKSHAADVPGMVKKIIDAATTEQGKEVLETISKQLALDAKDK